MAGAVLPWLSVYAGLKTYSGLAGLNGRLLLGGGALGLLGGVWYLRGRRPALHWALGLWGVVLLAFTGWLLVQLLAAYRGLAADPFFLARLGPGVPVATVGAAGLAATLLASPAGPARATPPAAAQARPLATGLAWLSAGAATIHFAVLGPHLRESWILGTFFAIVATAQMGWALVAAMRPSRLVWAAGAIGNALVVLVWVVSRTRGWPVGADAGGPEPVGVADGLSTAYEALIVAGAAALFRRPATGVQLRPGWARAATWAVAAVVAALTVVAVLSAVGALRLHY
ncbi:MAG TPA: hypothetical protein VGM21_14500 [Actinomycetota bacterium]|jgi:hypothetical protein